QEVENHSYLTINFDNLKYNITSGKLFLPEPKTKETNWFYGDKSKKKKNKKSKLEKATYLDGGYQKFMEDEYDTLDEEEINCLNRYNGYFEDEDGYEDSEGLICVRCGKSIDKCSCGNLKKMSDIEKEIIFQMV
ncbi:MAG: hypothetical protein WC781_05755, partial [Candidatus Pacearchaeota archaeon]